MKKNVRKDSKQIMNNSDIFSEEEMVDFDDDEKETVKDDAEDDFDDFEEDKSQPLMIALVSVGAVIALVVIIFIVVMFFTSGKDHADEPQGTIETEQTMTTEEMSIEESTENESALEEAETEETLSETEAETETETSTIIETQEENTLPVEESVQSMEQSVQEPVSGNESMEFAEVNDTVTAKDVTNLRSLPSTLDEANVVAQLLNGETVLRTGINEAAGWSRLEYNGQTVYAVSGYLTTDLNYKPPVVPSDPNRVNTQDGRVILFTNCDDYVTPKEYVNLRIEPSTSEGEATVRCQINNGDKVHRTGYSPDSGWSRVEYNGEVLYVVSSMIYTTE